MFGVGCWIYGKWIRAGVVTLVALIATAALTKTVLKLNARKN